MKDALDPKGLIRESFRIEGIADSECRSIFLDWALSRPEDMPEAEVIEALLARHSDQPQDHPMMQILKAARTGAAKPKRRGGWKARRADQG